MRIQQVNVSQSSGFGQALPPNPDRMTLIISSDGSSPVAISLEGQITALSQGILVPIGATPLVLTREMIGPAIGQALFWAQGAVNKQINVIEAFL